MFDAAAIARKPCSHVQYLDRTGLLTPGHTGGFLQPTRAITSSCKLCREWNVATAVSACNASMHDIKRCIYIYLLQKRVVALLEHACTTHVPAATASC